MGLHGVARSCIASRVSVEHPHSKAIAAAAREVLGPMGINPRGRSRTWLDDRGWWLGVIEFQPSSYSRGTYLNVGVHWLWSHEPGGLSFDYGYRVRGQNQAGRQTEYWESATGTDFTGVARYVAELARDRILELRDTFTEPGDIERLVTPLPMKLFDRAVALGLIGHTARAHEEIVIYIARMDAAADELEAERQALGKRADAKINSWIPRSVDVWRQRAERARRLQAVLDNMPALTDWIIEQIQSGRDSLKLGPPAGLPPQLRHDTQ
jgi:hypothetical protein